jgi:CheY-like chemotaxis protein
MKKQSIILSALLITAITTHAATMNEVLERLSSAAQNFGMQTFNRTLPTNVQNSSLVTWDQAFNQAKAFIAENSKDLMGYADPLLNQALSDLNQVNMDFINTIKVIRNTLPKAPISRLLTIIANAKKSTANIYGASFVLAGKKNARSLLISVGRFIEDAAKNIYDMLAVQAQ